MCGKLDELAKKITEASKSMELANPDADLSLINRVVNSIVEIVGVTVLSAIVVVVFVNAVARYALNFSFPWAEEFVQMSMPWLAMTGVFLSVRRGAMIRIDYFFEKIPQRLQAAVAIFGYMMNIAILLGLAYVSLDFVLLFGGDVALYVEMPTGWSTSALVCGAAGAAMAYFAEFFVLWRNKQLGLKRGDAET